MARRPRLTLEEKEQVARALSDPSHPLQILSRPRREPVSQGVTKKQAEQMLTKLHKSTYRIPESLKIEPNSADSGDGSPDD